MRAGSPPSNSGCSRMEAHTRCPSEGVMRKAAILSCGPYEVENIEVEGDGRLHEQYAVGRLPDIRRDAGAVRHGKHDGHGRGKPRHGPLRDPQDQQNAGGFADPQRGRGSALPPSTKRSPLPSVFRAGRRVRPESAVESGAISTVPARGSPVPSARAWAVPLTRIPTAPDCRTCESGEGAGWPQAGTGLREPQRWTGPERGWKSTTGARRRL